MPEMNCPMIPERNKSGKKIATVVMVPANSGIPNSRMVSTAASARVRPCATLPLIPSTITIAESTRIPIDRISAKREIKLMVFPTTRKATKAIMNESGIEIAAITDSRNPTNRRSTRNTNATVCKPFAVKPKRSS